MKVMVLCFVSHKVMTTPISCVCFGLVTTNTTLLVTLPSCGGWRGDYMLIYTHCWELMNSVGSHGSSSLLFVMKVMVCHFVSDSHEVMTALIVVLPLIVVVEISLQLHQACLTISWRFWSPSPPASDPELLELVVKAECKTCKRHCPFHQ